MEIHPIRNDDDLAAAIREIEKLWGAAVGTEEGDKLDILSTLVEKYEDSRWPNIDISDPIDLLNYAIEELGHSQAELAELLGSRSRASELLNRRRPLTVEMIHKDRPGMENPCRPVGETQPRCGISGGGYFPAVFLLSPGMEIHPIGNDDDRTALRTHAVICFRLNCQTTACSQTRLRDLAARYARVWRSTCRPLSSEGAGNAGRPMRPLPRVQR
jgi:HTH-type transcriptional regulator/antitoxin HigA